MAYVDFVSKMHKSTKRAYLRRLQEPDKAPCAGVPARFEKVYWLYWRLTCRALHTPAEWNWIVDRSSIPAPRHPRYSSSLRTKKPEGGKSHE
jgi:hypothetical protein